MKHEHTYYMEQALAEARKAAVCGETPIGAVVVVKGEIVGRGHNLVEQEQDASLHAELVALRNASRQLGRWRLSDASLYVTLEPCTMCLGALLLARVKTLGFGAYDSRQGAVGSVFDISDHPGLPHHLEVFPEILPEQSTALLKEFFQARRR